MCLTAGLTVEKYQYGREWVVPPATVEFLTQCTGFLPIHVVTKDAPAVLVSYEDVCAWVAAAGRLPAAKLHRCEDVVSGATVLYGLWAVGATVYTDAEGLQHACVKAVASRRREKAARPVHGSADQNRVVRSNPAPGGGYPVQMGDAASSHAPVVGGIWARSWDLVIMESDLLAGPPALTGALDEGVSFLTARGWTVRTLVVRLATSSVTGRGRPRMSEAAEMARLRCEASEWKIWYETLWDAFQAPARRPKRDGGYGDGEYRNDRVNSRTGECRGRNVGSDPYARRDVDPYAGHGTQVADPYDARSHHPQ